MSAAVVVVLVAVVILVLLGARLFVVVGAATMLCFVLILGEGSDVELLVRIINKVEGLTTKHVFLSIPLFVATGTVMTRGGMARRLVAIARAFVGWLPGGLAVAAVVASIIFAAISGSSPVTLVAVGTILFPALVEHKYPEKAAMGLLMTAGSLGCLVPPSVAMLIYAISVSGQAAVDPTDLFIAGLVPALGISALLAGYAIVVGLKYPESREPFSMANVVTSLKQGAFALALPVIILVGIYTQFTPTEAGAVALVYSVVVCVFVHRELTMSALLDALHESAILMGSLLLIVVLAFGLNDFLAEVEAAEHMGEWLRSAGLSPFMFFIVVNIALVFIGALMDSVSATLVFAPLLAPIAMNVYGIDPIHFGVVFVVNMEIGYLMPPVATNLIVGAAIFRRPFADVARSVLPTLGIVCVALVGLIVMPTFSKGILNARAGLQVWEPFPWDGKRVVQKPSHEPQPHPVGDVGVDDTVIDAGPKKAPTLDELMRRAKQPAGDAGVDASGADEAPKKKAPTLNDLMQRAAAQRAQDAGPPAVDAAP